MQAITVKDHPLHVDFLIKLIKDYILHPLTVTEFNNYSKNYIKLPHTHSCSSLKKSKYLSELSNVQELDIFCRLCLKYLPFHLSNLLPISLLFLQSIILMTLTEL